jgi:hypothetical protein
MMRTTNLAGRTGMLACALVAAFGTACEDDGKASQMVCS